MSCAFSGDVWASAFHEPHYYIPGRGYWIRTARQRVTISDDRIRFKITYRWVWP